MQARLAPPIRIAIKKRVYRLPRLVTFGRASDLTERNSNRGRKDNHNGRRTG